MKRIKLAIAFLLLLSFGCGLSAPSIPPTPSVLQTLPTVRPIYSPTPIPSPTASPTPTLTATPLPTISLKINEATYDFDKFILSGEVYGIPKETVTQSNLVLFLFNSYNTQLLEQSFPCTEPPQSQDAICAFSILIPNPPPDVFRYRLVAEIDSSQGQIVGEAKGLFSRSGPETANSKFNLSIKMPNPTSDINTKLPIDVSVSSFDNVAQVVSTQYLLCVYVLEERFYESSKTTTTEIARECKNLLFQRRNENSAEAQATFLFKPSGYGFVWHESEEGRYKITNIRATAMLRKDNVTLGATSADYLPVPVRVIEARLISDSQARARLKILAGEGETYNVTLKVYQIETDPDEVGWSAILLFIPCLLPGICDDRVEVGRTTEPITLQKGKEFVITTDYSPVPVSEEGNTIQGYSLSLFFEHILLMSSK